MKKLLSFIACLILLFSMPGFAMADGRLSVTGAGMSLSIPDGYYVFTYDTPSEYEGWTKLNLDQDYLIQYFQQNNMYLNAIAPDASQEIVVTQVTGEEQEYLFNLALYEDEVLSESFNELEKEFKAIGAKTGDMSFYTSGEQKYIYFDFFREEAGQKVNSSMYSTIYNGKTLNITMHLYGGEIGENERNLLKSVVDSVEFSEKLEPAGKIYADEESGFKIDWGEVVLSGVYGAVLAAVVSVIMSLAKKKKTGKAQYRGMHEK